MSIQGSVNQALGVVALAANQSELKAQNKIKQEIKSNTNQLNKLQGKADNIVSSVENRKVEDMQPDSYYNLIRSTMEMDKSEWESLNKQSNIYNDRAQESLKGLNANNYSKLQGQTNFTSEYLKGSIEAGTKSFDKAIEQLNYKEAQAKAYRDSINFWNDMRGRINNNLTQPDAPSNESKAFWNDIKETK